MTDNNFINACYGNNMGPIPVWMMRQAGRYLPEYLEVRKKATFHELCRSPELVAEVVSQPIRRFGFDVAILFSDILTLLEPMGIKVDFPEGGPVLENPIQKPEDVKRLKDFDVEKDLSFVIQAVRRTKAALPDLPLVGFAGSPYTLACYLIEGKGSKNFAKAKQFIYKYPDAAEEMFDLIVDVTGRYLSAQIEAGVDAVQLFESWGGVLSPSDFEKWSAEPADRIFSTLDDYDIPRIYFINNIAPYFEIIRDVNFEVAGVDYRVSMEKAAKALPEKALQGNLDPSVLFAGPEISAQKTREILDSVDCHKRLIFNLGHGILPATPLESVHKVVETVKNYNRHYEKDKQTNHRLG